MNRRHNIQTISWFFDLSQRDLLDLNPPYQRRSVWNQSFKDYFVDTVLLGLPAPAIFLFEEISPEGRSVYHVVDGKQRLTTLLEFVSDEFPISDNSQSGQQPGTYFRALSSEVKRTFWSYPFLVEYVPSNDEEIINGIFDRINRNVAKLTAQELRHARLDGLFMKTAENLAEWVAETLPRNFPRFAQQSRQQMKDVEFVGLLLLLLEEGPKSYSQDALDQAFTDRDSDWEHRQKVETEFRRTIETIAAILAQPMNEGALENSRLRNQADFYSLFGAIAENHRAANLATRLHAAEQLLVFIQGIDDDARREADPVLQEYYEAARSASNDRGPRERPYLMTLEQYVKDVVTIYCDKKGYAYAGRAKSSESLAEKIETGRFAKWSDLDDLFACTIVIPTLTDESEVLEYLNNVFQQCQLRRRGSTRKDPSVFRFDTTRFIGHLIPSAIDRSPVLAGMRFEVQIRTAFEHAWSVTTHALTYKASKVSWRHLRLAAQLRSAIEQLDQVVSGFEETAEFITEQQWPRIQAQQTIQERFLHHVQAGRVPQEVVPQSWTRFCENLYRAILSGVKHHPKDSNALVNRALDAIDAEITRSAGASFPRSVSLLQFCLGSLTKSSILTEALHEYVPLLTDELLDLFPESDVLGDRFDFEVSA